VGSSRSTASRELHKAPGAIIHVRSNFMLTCILPFCFLWACHDLLKGLLGSRKASSRTSSISISTKLPGLNPIHRAQSQLLVHHLTLSDRAPGQGVQVTVKEKVLVAVAHHEESDWDERCIT
jgi:hypothetical protein